MMIRELERSASSALVRFAAASLLNHHHFVRDTNLFNNFYKFHRLLYKSSISRPPWRTRITIFHFPVQDLFA